MRPESALPKLATYEDRRSDFIATRFTVDNDSGSMRKYWRTPGSLLQHVFNVFLNHRSISLLVPPPDWRRATPSAIAVLLGSILLRGGSEPKAVNARLGFTLPKTAW